MKKTIYEELRERLEENRRLGRGGMGRWRLTRPIAEGLAVRPWRVLVPAAVGISLLGWWLGGDRLTIAVLRVFGGR